MNRQSILRRRGAVALGAAMICTAALPAAVAARDVPPATEMLVYDWNSPITTKERGFPRHFPPTNNSAWSDDFAQGTYYFRLELKTMPTPQDIHLQYCIWQDAFNLENCTYPIAYVGTPNTVATWTQPLPKIWKKKGVPIDYKRPRQTDGFAIQDEHNKAISNYATWNWHGHDPNDWFPMDARLLVVVVKAGATFSGWQNYSSQTINMQTTAYEAEAATLKNAVPASMYGGFSGAGYVDYAAKSGGTVNWTVDSPTYADAKIKLRYANGSTKNMPVKIFVNNKQVVTFPCPPTGGWSNWTEVTLTRFLTRGANTVRAQATTKLGGPNIDFLSVETEAAPVTP